MARNNQLGRYHGGIRRRAGYGAALARGAHMAWRHRAAARRAGGWLARQAQRVTAGMRARYGNGVSGAVKRLFHGPRDAPARKRHNPGPSAVSRLLPGPGAGQYAKTRKKTGINRKAGYIAKVLSKQELKTRVLCIKNLRPFDGVNGAKWLHYREEVTNKQQYLCPLFIVDLMHKYVSRDNMFQMRMNSTNAANPSVSWVTQSHQSIRDGSAVSSWDTKHVSHGFPNMFGEAEKLHYGKANISLNLYGQKNRPVTFTVMLVAFKDEDVAPTNDYYVSNSNNTEHDIFWGEQLKTMIANPIARDNQQYQHAGKMKVLKMKKIRIEAAGTLDADNDPHVVTLNWTHGIHKTLSHVERRVKEDTAMDIANEKITNPEYDYNPPDNTTLVDQVVYLDGPKVKDRVYLIIKADVYSMVPSTVADAQINNTYAPSFDYNIHVSQYATKA